jgi:hypothetical protein
LGLGTSGTIPLSIASTYSESDATGLTNYHDLVVVTPAFTIRAATGYGKEDWVYVREPFEVTVHKTGQTLYSRGAIFIRRVDLPGEVPRTMFEYWGGVKLYKDPTYKGSRVTMLEVVESLGRGEALILN